MLTLYTAVGILRFQDSIKEHKTPTVINNRQEYGLTEEEFFLWSSLAFQIRQIHELQSAFSERLKKHHRSENIPIEPYLNRLLLRGLVVKGDGLTGVDALYRLLGELYISPLQDSFSVRLFTCIYLCMKKKLHTKELIHYLKKPARIAHKTETGLVKLNLRTGAEFAAAWRELEGILALHHADARREGMLVQGMVRSAGGKSGDVVETIVGVNRDGGFGSAVMVGLGGVFVELLRDVSLELAPLSPEGARAMIGRLKAAKLLTGFRGRAASDVEALSDVLVRVAAMCCALGDRLVSLDLNPVMVLPEGEGVRIVDIVMQVAPARHCGETD